MSLSILSCLAENTFALCENLAPYLSETLSRPVFFAKQLSFEQKLDHLNDKAMGWLCGLLYIRLEAAGKAIEPLVAPLSKTVPDQKPSYYSYLIVRQDSPYQSFTELAKRSLAINEEASFSGYEVIRYELAKRGKDGFFAEVIGSGSHLNSIGLVLAQKADCAAIDHTLFDYWAEQNPNAAHIRIIERLGPFPMPPVVVAKTLPAALKEELKAAFLKIPRERLEPFGMLEFQAVDAAYYHPIRKALELGATISLT